VEPKVIEWRRDIHQNPELGNREFRTSKLVAEHLRSLGMEVKAAYSGDIGHRFRFIPATGSDSFRPLVPIHSGRQFRGNPAAPSERSDAGVKIFLTERSGRVKL
jgi:hypothetical protein